MKTYNSYFVRPDWRNRGWRVLAKNAWDALRICSDRDDRLWPYANANGTGVRKFDWGTRYERGQVCVDIVTIDTPSSSR